MENQARLASLKITERATRRQSSYAAGNPPPQLRLHSNKRAEANPRTRRRRADYRNHSHVSDIARLHHRCHRSLDATTMPTTSPACRYPAQKDEAPKEEYDTRMPPTSDHKDRRFPPELHYRSERKGCASKAAMPPRKSTTATAAAIASPAQNRDRVFTQLHTLQPPTPTSPPITTGNLPARRSTTICRRLPQNGYTTRSTAAPHSPPPRPAEPAAIPPRRDGRSKARASLCLQQHSANNTAPPRYSTAPAATPRSSSSTPPAPPRLPQLLQPAEAHRPVCEPR
jgi:hypothetical protein